MQKYYVSAVVKKFIGFMRDEKSKDGYDLVGLIKLDASDADRKCELDNWSRIEEAAFKFRYPEPKENSKTYEMDHYQWERLFYRFYMVKMNDLYKANAELKGTLEAYFIPQGKCSVCMSLDNIPEGAVPISKHIKKK